eukprot:m.18671 g.18671  ORF g.18671 m.18671 type:complete len:330 (+) comp6379_c0_seq2:112-1101(+)
MEHTITEGVSVFVLNGKHKGWGGNVVYTTPKKLRLRRNDGTESGLIDKNHVKLTLDVTEDTDDDSGTPAVTPSQGSPLSPQEIKKEVKEDHAPAPSSPEAGNAAVVTSVESISHASYEENHIFDPSLMAVMMWISLSYLAGEKDSIISNMSSSYLIYFFMAAAVYFVLNIGALPARQKLTSGEWKHANGYRVLAGYFFYEGLVLLNMEKKDPILTVHAIVLFLILIPLCSASYMAILQARPERHAVQLVLNTLALTIFGYAVLTRNVNLLLFKCLDSKVNDIDINTAGGVQTVFEYGVLILTVHTMTISALQSYEAIKATYREVKGCGW